MTEDEKSFGAENEESIVDVWVKSWCLVEVAHKHFERDNFT